MSRIVPLSGQGTTNEQVYVVDVVNIDDGGNYRMYLDLCWSCFFLPPCCPAKAICQFVVALDHISVYVSFLSSFSATFPRGRCNRSLPEDFILHVVREPQKIMR